MAEPGGRPDTATKQRVKHSIDSIDNNISLDENQEQLDIFDAPLCSGYGQYHSPKNKKAHQDYIETCLNNIFSMVKEPQSIDKAQAQWFIPSTLKSRVHKEQRDKGKFYALWADIDEIGDILFSEIVATFQNAILPDTKAILYTTASARPDKQKSRVIIPLIKPVDGQTYIILQTILNDKLEALGITPDRVSQRFGQLCYLPNKGIISEKRKEIFYQYEILNGKTFNHSLLWQIEVTTHKERLNIQAKEQKARQQRAMQQVQQRINSGEANPVQAYKDTYPVETALEMNGYVRHGHKWLSPNSESGQSGVIIKDGRWISSHGSDSAIGRPFDGGTSGDAFDLYVYYECGGDYDQAVINAGNMFYINGKTINKHKQIEYMKKQEAELMAQQERQQASQTPPIDYNNPEQWEDPEPIEQKLLPVQPLPDEAIPTPFKGWIYDISQRWAVPLDFPFVSTILVASSIIGTGATIRPKKYDDWTVIPNLWGGIIGDPSVMKSPVLNEIVNKAIGRLEATASTFFYKELQEFETDNFIAKSIREAKEKDIKDTLKKDKNDLEKQTVKIQQFKKDLQDLKKNVMDAPTERRYKVNDCTVEKFVELNKENPRGLLNFRDELIGLFKKLDQEGRESDRAFYLESWNGNGSYTKDTVSRGTTRSDGHCMSLIGGIQPDKILSYLKDAMDGGNDGLVQRLQMMVYPDKEKWNFIDRYPDTEAKNNFYRIIEKLAAMQETDFIEAGATMPDGEKFPCFRFDDESYQLFKQWITDLQAKIEDPDEHNIVKEHLAKYKSLMPSLALIYHLIEIADKGYSEYEGRYINGGYIPEHCTRQAIACTDYLETHARRIYAMAIQSTDTLAIALSDKIIRQKLNNPFTQRDLYRKKWSLLNTPEAAEEAIKKLLQLEWLTEETTTSGRRTFTQYHINPKVFISNKVTKQDKPKNLDQPNNTQKPFNFDKNGYHQYF